MKDSEILIYLENGFIENFLIGLELAKNSHKLRKISDFARKLTSREYTYRYSYYLDENIAKFCYLRHSNIERNLKKMVIYRQGRDFFIDFHGLSPFDKRNRENVNYFYWLNINFRINNGKTI
jgi:hypothetical protein